MPRPITWKVPKTAEKNSLDLIGSGFLTFKGFAERSLRDGYDESTAISGHEEALELAERTLNAFELISDLQIAQLNDAEHAVRLDKFRRETFGPGAEKPRFEAMLVEAQNFVPPAGGQHQDFSDYLIALLQAKIATFPASPTEPQKPNLNAFKAKRRAKLRFIVQRLKRSKKGSAADIDWLKKLSGALK